MLVALGANLLIAVAKAVGGLLAGSPALLSEAAHSVADSMNEVFLLAALRRSRRPADHRHPFGYGKERFSWSLLAAVGIFVMGGGAGGMRDPALRTVVAEDGTAVIGVLLAITGMVLHMVTGQVVWEACASLAIGALLVGVAFWLGRDARDQLIGRAADEEASRRIRALLEAQPEIDSVEALLTMQLGLGSTLVAARIDLVPGLDSEEVEEVAVRIEHSVAHTVPEADQIFLDVTDAGAAQATGRGNVAAESPAATGERGGA